MTKSNLMQIILVIACALIIVGVVLVSIDMATPDDENVIDIKLENGETETVKFDNLALIPGDFCEYRINLKRDGAARYDLKLDFVELEDKSLKNFARVKIMSGDNVLYDELLATAFLNDDLVLPVDFKENINTDLTVVYYLPEEVGNEAKNTEAVFELLFTASNE